MSPALPSLLRKALGVARDPVLRAWLAGRALGRRPAPPTFTAHWPSYLADRLPLGPETPAGDLADLDVAGPEDAIDLGLPGADLRLAPGDEAALFTRPFADLETSLALHRFAWLDSAETPPDPAWVACLWDAWCARHGTPDDGWAWHPYTAAERAINILRFARRHGLPGPRERSLEVLSAHGPAIARRLEYFGEHDTSNHLANDGRGLYLLGLWLGLPKCAGLGGAILSTEAARIFRPSGVLREGSSHYHALYADRYLECAEAAADFGRPEAPALRAVANRALAVLSHLWLGGGLPLVGDISPDIPPARLLARLERRLDGLDDATRRAEAPLLDAEALRADGWIRGERGDWSILCHTAPDGWPQMPGHGHQDCGGFELHWRTLPVIVDPGRGAYGEDGEAALYRSAEVHGGLTVDGRDPYPPNKPYYTDAFRRSVAGPPPETSVDEAGLDLRHEGFTRLAGVGVHERRWRFDGPTMTIADSLDGRGRHRVRRTLCTPLAVREEGDGLTLRGDGQAFRLTWSGGGMTTAPAKRWIAYGRSEAATFIHLKSTASLPWRGRMELTAI